MECWCRDAIVKLSEIDLAVSNLKNLCQQLDSAAWREWDPEIVAGEEVYEKAKEDFEALAGELPDPADYVEDPPE